MKVAIPVVQGKLSMHFGHAEGFAIIEIEDNSKDIKGTELIPAPPHQPGLLPSWLGNMGVDLVIVSGMGRRAQGLFKESGIDVITGAPCDNPEMIVRAYLSENLATGDNICDH